MLRRSLALVCVMTLSASAQPPAPKAPTAGSSLCQSIASMAFDANRGLRATTLTDADRKAPFVSSWLVQNALKAASDGSYSSMGLARGCDGPVTEFCYGGPTVAWVLPYSEAGGDLPEEIANNLDDYARWVSTIGLLPVDGELLQVMGEPEHGPYNYNVPSGAFLKSVFGSGGLMCAFDNRLHERYWPEEPETQKSCAALLSDGSEVLEPSMAVPVGVDQKMFRTDNSMGSFYDFEFLGTLKLDIDGDGSLEHLIKVRGSPGNGRCYGATYYDVLDSRDPTKFSSEPVRELVKRAQSTRPACGYETRLRRVGARVMFEVAGLGLGAVQKQGTPIIAERAGLLERQLRDVSQSKVRDLCSTTFSVEPVVLYAR